MKRQDNIPFSLVNKALFPASTIHSEQSTNSAASASTQVLPSASKPTVYNQTRVSDFFQPSPTSHIPSVIMRGTGRNKKKEHTSTISIDSTPLRTTRKSQMAGTTASPSTSDPSSTTEVVQEVTKEPVAERAAAVATAAVATVTASSPPPSSTPSGERQVHEGQVDISGQQEITSDASNPVPPTAGMMSETMSTEPAVAQDRQQLPSPQLLAPELHQFISEAVQCQLTSTIPAILQQMQDQMLAQVQGQLHSQMLSIIQTSMTTYKHGIEATIQTMQENMNSIHQQMQLLPIQPDVLMPAPEDNTRLDQLEQDIQGASARIEDQVTRSIHLVGQEVEVKVKDLEKRVARAEKIAERAEQQCFSQGATCSAAAADTVLRVKQLAEDIQKNNQQQHNTRTPEKTTDTEESSLYIKGIWKIKNHLHSLDGQHGWLQADPAEATAHLFNILGAAGAIQRIVLADIKATGGNRQQVDAVIVKLSSVFQKKSAIFRIRNYTHQTGMESLMLSDCYPQQHSARARALVRYCGYLKEHGKISNYSVTNRRGTPDVQTYLGMEAWQHLEVDDNTLQPFYTNRTTRGEKEGAIPKARGAESGGDLGAVGRGRGGGSTEGGNLGAVGRGGGSDMEDGRPSRARGKAYNNSRPPMGKNIITSPNNSVILRSQNSGNSAPAADLRKFQLMYEGKQAEIEEMALKLSEMRSNLGAPPLPTPLLKDARNVLYQDDSDQ
jgi:hypothetical protein